MATSTRLELCTALTFRGARSGAHHVTVRHLGFSLLVPCCRTWVQEQMDTFSRDSIEADTLSCKVCLHCWFLVTFLLRGWAAGVPGQLHRGRERAAAVPGGRAGDGAEAGAVAGAGRAEPGPHGGAGGPEQAGFPCPAPCHYFFCMPPGRRHAAGKLCRLAKAGCTSGR